MYEVSIDDAIDALEYLISEDCTSPAVDYTMEVEKAIAVMKDYKAMQQRIKVLEARIKIDNLVK